MQFKSYLQSKLPLYLALGSLFMLASCGSYQYVGNDSDGIYRSPNEVTYTDATPRTSNNNNYYKEYFAEKSDQYGNIAQDDNVIFTNIDDYQGNYNDENGEIQYEEGYAGWGQNADNVNINIYSNNGWNNFGYWNRPWAFGFNNWYGYDWYGGFYNPFWYPSAFYGGLGFYGGFYGGFYNPYFFGYNNFYNGYYGNHHYHRNVAYNAGRRGSDVYGNNNRSTYRPNSTRATSRNSSIRSNNTIRRSDTSIYNPSNSTRSGTRVNSSNVRSNTRGTRVNTTNTRSNTRVNTPSSSSSSPAVRSSSGSTRSSGGGATRSSGSSSRRGG